MNRLAGEQSPYLRQHAENPVDWRPWGEAAFDEARVAQLLAEEPGAFVHAVLAAFADHLLRRDHPLVDSVAGELQ